MPKDMQYDDISYWWEKYVDEVDSDGATFFQGWTEAGDTQLFRERALQEGVMKRLITCSKSDTLRVLIVPGSTGMEAATLAMIAKTLDPDRKIEIHSLDRHKDFVDFASYFQFHPKAVEKAVPDEYMKYFNEAAENGFYELKPEIQDMITLLPPQDVMDFEAEESYDAVFTLNLLQHLKPEQVLPFLKKVSGLSNQFLSVNAIDRDHLDDISKQQYESISPYLEAQGFRMLTRKFEALDTAFPSYKAHQSKVRDEPWDFSDGIESAAVVLERS